MHTKAESIRCRIDADVRNLFETACRRSGVTKSEMVRELIAQRLEFEGVSIPEAVARRRVRLPHAYRPEA